LIAAIGFAGCKLTPDYERPDLDLPSSWTRSVGTSESIANLEWWEVYQDEVLTSLIEAALNDNQDLGVALARMQEAEYLVTFTRADQFPFIDVFGGASRGRQSRDVVPGANTENRFQLDASLSFEVDLWRKLSRASEAARADLLASEAVYRSVTISLVADVASTYLLLRDFDSRLEISRATSVGRLEHLEIIRARFEKGTVPELDVNQAEIQLAIAEAAVAAFERQVAQTEHALRVLLGRYPGPIPRGKPVDLEMLAYAIPVGLPVQLVDRRPDIVSAEQELIAATARVGEAEALRYPALSLTASIGSISEDLSDLTSNDAKTWNIMAGVVAPIFNSGKLKAQARAQRARAEQARHSYLGALQDAFREIEDALIAIQTLRAEYAARDRQVVASRNASRLSRARYDGGVVDYLEVLDTERTLFDSELEASSVLRAGLSAFVDLYKALGGGWSEREDDEAGVDPSAADAVERDLRPDLDS